MASVRGQWRSCEKHRGRGSEGATQTPRGYTWEGADWRVQIGVLVPAGGAAELEGAGVVLGSVRRVVSLLV